MHKTIVALLAFSIGASASTPAICRSQTEESFMRALRAGIASPSSAVVEVEHADAISIRAFTKGRLVIVDARWPRVLVIDSSGRTIASIEQVGEGPGDVRMPYRVALHAGQQLIAVYDAALKRISVFDQNLRLKASLSATSDLPTIGSITFDASGRSLFLATATTSRMLSSYAVHRLSIEDDSITGSLIRDSTSSLGAAIRFGVGVVAGTGSDQMLFVQKYPLALRRFRSSNAVEAPTTPVYISDLTSPDSAFSLDIGDNGGPRIRARSDVSTMTAAFPVTSELTLLAIVRPNSLAYVLAARDGSIVGSARGKRGSTAIADIDRHDRRIWFARRENDRGIIKLWPVRY